MDNQVESRKGALVENLSYHIEYLLEKSPNAYCSIPNELILNNTGDYYEYDPISTMIDGVSAPLVLNVPGSFITLNALEKDIRLQFILNYTNTQHPLKHIPRERCINTQYGFKLSEPIGCMESFTYIAQDEYGGKIPGAKLSIIQSAYKVDGKIIFNFKIMNHGKETAREILFKDILPEGIHLKLGGIYMNGCHAYPEYVNIRGRLLIIKIQDIIKGNSEMITLVCDMDENIEKGQVNIGCIAYVSSYTPMRRVEYNLKIIQSISNAKGVDDLINC